jgi:hypothetical protein
MNESEETAMSAQGTPAGAPNRTETTFERAKPIAL